jgi:hypothetical protein
VLIVISLDRPGWNWRQYRRHMFVANKAVVHASTQDGQIMHTFMTNIRNNSPLSGDVRVRGLSSNTNISQDWDI